MKRFAMIVAAGLLLAACSTNIEHRIALPQDVKGGLQVSSVDAVAPAGMLPHVPLKLRQAVQAELAKRAPGSRQVGLKLTITRFEIVSSSGRMWAGAFAGTNYMDVTVTVHDPAGVRLAEFDVRRESNPGGYGAFYDQEHATVQATAEGIVAALYDEQ